MCDHGAGVSPVAFWELHIVRMWMSVCNTVCGESLPVITTSYQFLFKNTTLINIFINLFPLLPDCTAFPGYPSRCPMSTSRGPPHAGLYWLQRRPHRRFLTPCSIDSVIGHIKRWRCIRCRLRQWSQIISAHLGDFQSRISGRNVSFSSSLKTSFFRVSTCLTAAWQQWTLDSDSELDFDGFVTVEFGENGHFAANLAPETMWINFFLTGMSDVNSDSSDADSASVAMSLTATILWHPDVG